MSSSLERICRRRLGRFLRSLSSSAYDAYWMPFSHNRAKAANMPNRLLVRANGMHYYDANGKAYLDSCAGLWCVNAGHSNPRVSKAIAQQAAELDYCSSFQIGHPAAFSFAARVVDVLGVQNRGIGKVFFCNSGSEAVDSSLKIALAYHRARGDGTRMRFIGRERGYHGTGFGGLSVGGIPGNRAHFSPLALPGVDHLSSPYAPEHSAFSRGEPSWGLHLADELERVVELHDATNVAAVIVEPVAGSGGVVVPPQGYLKRLREICDRNGILLIFDEVITAFGRLGTPCAAEYYNVTPDLMTVAKGITNGAVPCGAVLAQDKIYQAIMDAADKIPGSTIELFHGYTYSGCPLAMAAGHAVLDAYTLDGIWQNAADVAGYFQDAVHSLRTCSDLVSDIRGLGLMAGVDITPLPGKPGERIGRVFAAAAASGLLLRVNASTVQLTPPLIVERRDIDEIVDKLGRAIKAAE